MQLFNCHTHSCYSHDATGTIDEICESAVKSNLSGFAVTDHCDCEYADDIKMNEALDMSYHQTEYASDKYKGKLIVAKGIEIGEALFNKAYSEKILNAYNWDVVLASVHAVRMKDFEMPFSTIDFSKHTQGFINEYIRIYFEDLAETAFSTDYDILSHLTVILRYVNYKYKREADISCFMPVITDILKTVISRNKTLEVNTSGFRDGYFMPDKDIIKLYYSMNGRNIAIGSDSHCPENISLGLYECAEFLKETGFTHLTYYIDRKPVEYTL